MKIAWHNPIPISERSYTIDVTVQQPNTSCINRARRNTLLIRGAGSVPRPIVTAKQQKVDAGASGGQKSRHRGAQVQKHAPFGSKLDAENFKEQRFMLGGKRANN